LLFFDISSTISIDSLLEVSDPWNSKNKVGVASTSFNLNI